MFLIKRIKKVLLVLLAIFLISNVSFNVKAAEVTDWKNVISNNMKEVSNGCNVEYSINKDNYKLNAKINSNNLKKGYYTTIFYNNLESDFLNYQMISFNINNEAKGELRINFMINKTNGTNIAISSDKYVLLKKENSDLTEKVFASYGSITIPQNFKGTVYIPFNNLEKSKTDTAENKLIVPDMLTWWGIDVITSENEEKVFTLDDFKLINLSPEISRIDSLKFQFEGDDKVQIPVNGESIAKYNTKIYSSNGQLQDNKIIYKIDNPKKGISISSDGVLKVNTDVVPQKIKIDAIIDGCQIYEGKEIQLYKSWTLNSKNIDKSIPKPNKVPKLNNIYEFFLSTNTMNGIRIFSLVVILLGAFLYVTISRKNNF